MNYMRRGGTAQRTCVCSNATVRTDRMRDCTFSPTHPVVAAQPIQVPVGAPPALFVVVDTEEEFDWSAPYRRENTRVTALRHIGRAQSIFDRFGVKPVYVVDYAVASQPDGYLPLREIARAGRCDVGAHLHPWVNPPFDEELSVANSFTMNLPSALQRAKLAQLCAAIESSFDTAPAVFKAGRYGLGADTVGVLDQLGFTVDNSVCPRFNFSRQHGPNFDEFDCQPFFLTSTLLEMPCTVDYVGWAGAFRPALHRFASQPSLERLRAVGVLSRSGAANRIMLSPEGNSFDEMRALTEALYDRGVRTFTLSFHSPSVAVGHTPYVRSQNDLEAFLVTVERYLEYFMRQRNGRAMLHREFHALTATTPELS